MYEFTVLLFTAVFAVSGALAATQKRLDITGLAFFAVITGLGGGTVRDLLLGMPVFWVSKNSYITVCLISAFLVWFMAHIVQTRYRWLLWADAIGMAGFSILGVSKALSIGAPEVIAVSMGVVTATVGGLLRDIVSQSRSVLVSNELYITASFIGCMIYVVMFNLGLQGLLVTAFCISIIIFIRGGAIIYRWSLPSFPSQNDSSYDDS